MWVNSKRYIVMIKILLATILVLTLLINSESFASDNDYKNEEWYKQITEQKKKDSKWYEKLSGEELEGYLLLLSKDQGGIKSEEEGKTYVEYTYMALGGNKGTEERIKAHQGNEATAVVLSDIERKIASKIYTYRSLASDAQHYKQVVQALNIEGEKLDAINDADETHLNTDLNNDGNIGNEQEEFKILPELSLGYYDKEKNKGQTTADEMMTEADTFVKSGTETIDEKDLAKTVKNLYNILLAIAIAAAIIVGTYLCIKLITSSVEGQAKIKEMFIPYIIGCVVAFGAFGIWSLVMNIFNSMG